MPADLPSLFCFLAAPVEGLQASPSSGEEVVTTLAHNVGSSASAEAKQACRELLQTLWGHNPGPIILSHSRLAQARFLHEVLPEVSVLFVMHDPYRRIPDTASPHEYGQQWNSVTAEFLSGGSDIGKMLNIDGHAGADAQSRLSDLLGRPVAAIEREQPVLEKHWRCLFRTVEPLASQLGFSPPQHVIRTFQAPAVEDRSKCVVLVPIGSSLLPECDESLRELERRGYPVRRIYGYAAIDQGRNQMATDALRDGFEQTMWIDADIGFAPDAVDYLRSLGEPIACGIYAQKGKRSLACHPLPTTKSIAFGADGGLLEIQYAGAGFLLVHRDVYQAVQERLEHPLTNQAFGSGTVPYFQPLIRPHQDGYWYLAEDFAFCERARQAGFAIMADTSIRLWHIGHYAYGWENAGLDRETCSSFEYHFWRTE